MPLSDWVASYEPARSRALHALGELPRAFNGKGAAAPFPFVDRERLRRGLSNEALNAAIARAPTVKVAVGALHSIQHSVQRARVAEYLTDPAMPALQRAASVPVDVPIVMRRDGVDVIWDGNHRATAAKLRGEQQLKVRLVDLDALANQR